ncbi:MAG: hypothetical protein LIP10_14700 [Clostridiales bacterium]|nr:hypothetical protein [Clostridiales bacterium]
MILLLLIFPLERLVQLCDLFSVDLDYLVRGIDHRAPAESNVPYLVIDLFKPDNEARRQLAMEYFLMFKKIYGDGDK